MSYHEKGKIPYIFLHSTVKGVLMTFVKIKAFVELYLSRYDLEFCSGSSIPRNAFLYGSGSGSRPGTLLLSALSWFQLVGSSCCSVLQFCISFSFNLIINCIEFIPTGGSFQIRIGIRILHNISFRIWILFRESFRKNLF